MGWSRAKKRAGITFSLPMPKSNRAAPTCDVRPAPTLATTNKRAVALSSATPPTRPVTSMNAVSTLAKVV